MRDQRDVGILMDGHHPIMLMQTTDERLAMLFLSRLASRRSLPLHQWTQTEGLRLVSDNSKDERFFTHGHTLEPKDVLMHIKSKPDSACYVLCDLHSFLKDPYITRLLKDIVLQQHENSRKLIVLMSHEIQLPGELKPYSTHLALPFPNQRKLLGMINQELKQWMANNRGTSSFWNLEDIQNLSKSLEGYSNQDAQVWIRNALHREQVAQSGSTRHAVDVRKRLFSGTDILHYVFDLSTLNDIAGYSHYKNWLSRQKGMGKPPKSILIFGAEGCGKSQAATATSSELSLPILKLELENWMSISDEESDHWLEWLKTLDTAVIWLDRIDTQTLLLPDSTRLRLQHFLDKLSSQFWLIATSSTQSMPFFELSLADRFTERFFVDLPHFEVRKQIVVTQLNTRQININSLNLRELANHSDGLSGAQIEQSLVEAIHTAAATNEVLEDAHVIAEMSVEKPALFDAYDYLDAMRKWASDHASTAD